MTKYQKLRQTAVQKQNAAFHSRPRPTKAQLDDLRNRIIEQKVNPQPLTIQQVDAPYLDTDFYKGRWVVHVLEGNRVTVRPTDNLFDSEEEAQAFYSNTLQLKQAS